MSYSSRFFLYAPLSLFLLLAAGAGLYWWHVAQALSARLDALNGRAAMPGVVVAFKSKSVGGFPFNLDVVFSDFRITIDTPHGPSSWATQKFALHALTYGREQMIFEAGGDQALRWRDLQGRAHALPFQVGEMHASAIAADGAVSRIDFDLIGFGSPALTAARVQMHARKAPGGAGIDIFATADGVHLSPALAPLFGPDVSSVKLNARAMPAKPIDALREGRAGWVDALEGWRAAGGAVEVGDLEISWNRLSAMGKGRLSLDAAHAVEGLLDFKVAGIETLLDAARRHDVRGGPDQGLAAALLDRAALAGDNEAGLLGAVIDFHAGVVTLGTERATTEEPLY
ncbi:MAG TPA: DUF2125 domain-containing protein [Rhizomicrobium sp.]